MRLLGRLQLDKQRRLLIGAILVVTALLVFLLAKSYLGFKNAEQGWQAYSDRHVQLTAELAALRQHFGYGGLIHNFKNLVLRRDPARYQSAIENNIINLQQALAALSASVDKPAAAAALQTVADTINLYIKNYRITLQMIASGADSATIDAVVKVSDIPAYQALAQLDQYLAATGHQLRVETEQQSRQALYFMLSGVVLLLPLMLIVSGALLMFL